MGNRSLLLNLMQQQQHNFCKLTCSDMLMTKAYILALPVPDTSTHLLQCCSTTLPSHEPCDDPVPAEASLTQVTAVCTTGLPVTPQQLNACAERLKVHGSRPDSGLQVQGESWRKLVAGRILKVSLPCRANPPATAKPWWPCCPPRAVCFPRCMLPMPTASSCSCSPPSACPATPRCCSPATSAGVSLAPRG